MRSYRKVDGLAENDIQENRSFNIIKLLLLIVAIILLAIGLSQIYWIKTHPGCAPTTCNCTFNGELNCPVPVFNGTLDFNGTVIFNGTVVAGNGTCPPLPQVNITVNATCPPVPISNLVINETACGSQSSLVSVTTEPCAMLLYDAQNNVCVKGFTLPDASNCNHVCYDTADSQPTCASGKCIGKCLGTCNTVQECPDLTSIFGFSRSLHEVGELSWKAQCSLTDDGNGIVVGDSFFDTTQFGAPDTVETTYTNTGAIPTGYCYYTISMARFIDSVEYGSHNETFATSDDFCRHFIYKSTVLSTPPPMYDFSQCLEPIGSMAYTFNVTDTLPYRMKTITTCDYAFVCSNRKSPSPYLIL